MVYHELGFPVVGPGWLIGLDKETFLKLAQVRGRKQGRWKMAAEKPWLRRGARRHYFDARGTLLPVKNACH